MLLIEGTVLKFNNNFDIDCKQKINEMKKNGAERIYGPKADVYVCVCVWQLAMQALAMMGQKLPVKQINISINIPLNKNMQCLFITLQ